MLMHYEEAGREIRLLQDEVTGTLQIGASFTIGEYVLPARLADFARQYPLVSLQVTIGNTEEIIAAVRSNRLDIGFIEGETSGSDLSIIPYMKDEMILVAPSAHPLSSELAVEDQMLHNEVWVLREPGSGTRAFSDRFCRNQVFRSNAPMYSTAVRVSRKRSAPDLDCPCCPDGLYAKSWPAAN